MPPRSEISEVVTDDLFGAASSITVVLHGVGDHTPVDIVQAAKSGFDAAKDSSLSASAHAFNFQDLGGDDVFNSGQILQVRSANGTHLVIPLVWSHNRARVSEAYGPNKDIDDADAFYGRLLRIGLILRELVKCRKTVGMLGTSILILAFALLFVSVAVVTVLGIFAVVVPFLLPFAIQMKFFRPELAKSHFWLFTFWDNFGGIVSIPFFVIGLPFSWAMFSHLNYALVLYDYLGDVVHYCGNEAQRIELEAALITLLQHIHRRAPRASFVVVAHSLGTVLAGQALTRLGKPFPRKLTFVTVGSPLRLMSSVCARAIPSPSTLLSRFEQAGIIERWFNFWRDSDLIGKRVIRKIHGGITETSLGPGGHANYWADVRFWNQLRTLPPYAFRPEEPATAQHKASAASD